MKIVIFFILIIGVCQSEPNTDKNCSLQHPLSAENVKATIRCAKEKFGNIVDPVSFIQGINSRALLFGNCEMVANVTTFKDFISNCYCFIKKHAYEIAQVADMVTEGTTGHNPHLADIFKPPGNNSRPSMMPDANHTNESHQMNQSCPGCVCNCSSNVTQTCPQLVCNCSPNVTQSCPKSECNFNFNPNMPNLSSSCSCPPCSKCDREMCKYIKFMNNI